LAISENEPLTEGELAILLEAAQDAKAILIGGQSVAILARRYADKFPRTIDPITSSDIDFLGNAAAARNLASRFKDANVYLPTPFDDATTNSAVVTAVVGEHRIRIDFMSHISWVDSRNIQNRFLTLSGWASETGESIRILCLHPLDCLMNRLGNINAMKRTDAQAIRSAEASVMVLDAFIDEMLSDGAVKRAKECFQALEYIVRNKCAGRDSYQSFGIDPSVILEKYMQDARLDERYRNKTMAGQLARARAALAGSAKRLDSIRQATIRQR
jgi:hypothetical protein